ncbi:hypothetical protein GCM10023155_22970 [Bremerella cremea]
MMRNRLLVIESTEAFRRQVHEVLCAHHEIKLLECGAKVRETIETFQPELILLDFHLADDSAIEVCRTIRREFVDRQIQLLVLGKGLDESQRLELFAAGADDIIDKSISRLELTAKIDVLTRLHSALMRATTAERKLEGYSRELERIVEARSQAIQSTQDIAVFALAKLADSRDTETGEHLVRMRAYTQMIAEQLRVSGPYQDEIDEQFLSNLYRSSPLHDIGKVGISDAILLKPDRLTDEEYNNMKQHVRIGAETLEEAAQCSPSGSFFDMAAQIARYHHERWDGTGYLEGLSRLQIPLAARIVSVADVFDALTSKRIYKDAIDPQTAYEMVCQEKGKQFDPAVVTAFDEVFDKLVSFSADYHHHFMNFSATTQPAVSHYHRSKRQTLTDLIEGETVILIDNGCPTVKLLSGWLQEAGMKLSICREYATAKHLIRDECPMLVIAEWGADVVAGELFFRWLREEYLPRYVYTMVIADQRTMDVVSQTADLGIDDVIAYKISREELLARLNSATRVIELENNLSVVERNDPLTGLATLRYLSDQLKREWIRARNYHLPISCIMVDIDDFSGINDRYGAEAGDKVLQQLATTIADQGRQVDYVCRLERDRILFVLPECAEISAYRVAKRIEMAVDQVRIDIGGREISCTVSMGVAERTNSVPDLDTLIRNAEMALKVAKSSGERHVVCLKHCQETASAMADEDHVRESLEHLTAAEIMTKPVLSVRETDTIASVAKFLLKHEFNSVPVVDMEGCLTGIISEKDLMQAFRKPDAWSRPVSEVMERDVVRFNEHEPCLQIYEFLSQASMRRVIVVKDGRPTGVISRGNCLRYMQSVDANAALGDPAKLANVLDSGVFEVATLNQLREILKTFESNSPSLESSSMEL